jgi:enoyl-[acyl-carrier protein] reductase I
MSGILEGKRVLISGVLLESSIAFHAAKQAQEQGAEIILTAFPRPTLTERIAKKLPKPTKVIELDVTNDEHLARVADVVGEELGGLDGVVHSIGFAPPDALGGNFLNTPFASVATAMHVSAFSLKSLTMACLPLMQNGGSVVGLTFDASFAWPQYDWMGPASPRARSARWPPSPSRASASWPPCGTTAPPWSGTSTTRSRPARPSSPS